MFSHIMVGSNDIARSKKFYDALFAAIGGKPGAEDARGRLVYTHNGGRFMVSKPIDGKPATPRQWRHDRLLDERAPNRPRPGTRPGSRMAARSIEDPPGVRQGAAGHYLAYLRDPDGNKLCAVYRAGLSYRG